MLTRMEGDISEGRAITEDPLRTWDVSLSLPRISTVGVYKMSGTIPPNLDLGFSTGDQRFVHSSN